MGDDESNFMLVMGSIHMHGKKVFEDAMIDRSVCKRKVIIEKSLPKYVEPVTQKPDREFLTSMGIILLVGESIHRVMSTRIGFRKKRIKKEKPQEDVRNSLWEIAKFTSKNWLSGVKSKWTTKKVPK